jgi:hypothetical protein
MRRAVLLAAAAVLLLTPMVLAFFSGGYFDEPRLIATLVIWILVALVAVAGDRPLPASVPGRLALAGLVLVTAWSGLSLTWAPLSDPATASLVRLLMYLGAFVAAASLLGEPRASDAVEPALALGAVVVIGYALAGRLLPGIVEQTESALAFGRLEQPITYWNAEGALAAMGLVLCARLAGAGARHPAVRIAAAAACAPLGLGVYLSYSRGAIAAAVVGLVVLLAVAPCWEQLRAAAVASGAAVLATLGGAFLPGVASLEGTAGERETDGAMGLAILLAVMGATAFAQARACQGERRAGARTGRLRVARRLPVVAGVAVALGLAVLVAAGLDEAGTADRSSERRGASRLTDADSRRYDYWRVGLDAFAEDPLGGLGAGGFRVEWLRERPVEETALEIHSLPLEMAAELGLVGLLGFGLLVGGVGVAGTRALGRHPALAPGPIAGATVWFLHAAIDWDWQIPAVTLPAIVMAGALVAASETEPVSPVTRAGSAA